MKKRLSGMGVVLMGGLLVGCESTSAGGGPDPESVAPSSPAAAPTKAKAVGPAKPPLEPVPVPAKRTPVPDATSNNPGLKGEVRAEPRAPGEITSVDIEQLFLMKGEGKALVVDVRPGVFYAMGHIEGAISLPLKTFPNSYPKKKGELDAAVGAGRVIVLYCANLDCPDGYAVARRLAADGYSTSLYKGGWSEWKAAGLE